MYRPSRANADSFKQVNEILVYCVRKYKNVIFCGDLPNSIQQQKYSIRPYIV